MRDNGGLTAPAHAAGLKAELLEIVRVLVAADGDVQLADNNGDTPLHHGVPAAPCGSSAELLARRLGPAGSDAVQRGVTTAPAARSHSELRGRHRQGAARRGR